VTDDTKFMFDRVESVSGVGDSCSLVRAVLESESESMRVHMVDGLATWRAGGSAIFRDTRTGDANEEVVSSRFVRNILAPGRGSTWKMNERYAIPERWANGV
jgi:hypothetical protein